MVYDYYKEKNSGEYKRKILLSVILVVIVAALILAASMYLEIIQLEEIGGYSSVFWVNFNIRVAVMIATFMIIFVLLVITNFIIRKNFLKFFKDTGITPVKLPNYSVAALLALAGSFIYRDVLYQKALVFLNGVVFGKADPIFGHDISYYALQRPFAMASYNFISSVWAFVIIYTASYYLYVFGTIFKGIVIEHLKRRDIIIHNVINIAMYFLIQTVSYKFIMENVLFSDFINVTGAGFVDLYIWKNFYMAIPFILTVLTVVSVILFLKRKYKYAAGTIAIYPLLFLLVTMIAALVQTFVVSPNELAKEKPFLKYAMEKTREAFKIDNLSEHQFDIKQNLSLEMLDRNEDIINNIRVIDYKSTLQSNNQMQSIRTFFSFVDGDIINYTVNGKEIPVMISAREIDRDKIPEKKYVNTTFKYTHGHGVVINPINDFSQTGQIDYIVKDLDQKSTAPEINVVQPRIYYGENTNNHVITNVKDIKEIDKDINDETTYDGQGGIKLNFLNKILFSLKYGDLNMLISEYVLPQSKILINRNILLRAQMAVPFLKVDDDPYIIVTKDGRLKWVIDAYTTTEYYPYSQHVSDRDLGELNYIRNSVKIVVDAYDGKVKYYVIDQDDPIIKTYRNIYPDLFSKEELPDDIKEHMRYPEKLFKIQTEILKRYHIDPNIVHNSVEIFYNNQDQWDIAKYTVKQEENNIMEIEPFYNMIRLPKMMGSKMELILMRPFTPIGKDNMVSWVAVRNSYQDYGKLILYVFPKNKLVYGPNQVETQINQHPDISKDITLWGQQGSRVFKGNLLVIPIEDSILYVEPVYIEAVNKAAAPRVVKVVTAYQAGESIRISHGPNIRDALESMLRDVDADSVGVPERLVQIVPTMEPDNEGLRKLLEKYSEVKKAWSSGDWEVFGKKMKELDGMIEELKKDNEKNSRTD